MASSCFKTFNWIYDQGELEELCLQRVGMRHLGRSVQLSVIIRDLGFEDPGGDLIRISQKNGAFQEVGLIAESENCARFHLGTDL